MDLLPIGFLLLLVVIGGGIAWAGDELGRKLGKKRLSLFGLRPKHTARVGTVALGVVVSFFTILMVSAMSQGVRQWILQGNQAIHQRDQKIKELQKTESELSEDQVRFTTDQTRILRLEYQINQGDKKLSSQGMQLISQSRRLNDLKVRQQALQARLIRTDRMITEKDAQIHETQANLTANEKQLAQNEKMLASVQRSETGAVKNLNESRMHAEGLSVQIAAQQQSLAALRNQRADLQTQKESLGKELESTKGVLASISNDAAQERQNLYDLQEKEGELNAKVHDEDAFIRRVVGPSRVNPLIFGVGQEVTRLTVPDHLSHAEALNALNTLLKEARTIAEAHGARGHAASPAPVLAADVYEQDGIQSSEWEAKWVDELTGKPVPEVAIASSYVNAFQGEPVSLVIDVKENPFVFKKGEVVAESPIDGGRTVGEIYEALSRFLSNQVRTRTREKQMIPSESDDVFGNVSTDQVLKAVQTIKSAGRPVRLQAVASSDTHAADSLKLDLQVR